MSLPNNLDIERVFLASLVKYPETIPDYLEYLDESLFHTQVHKIICNALKFQFREKKAIDVVIISDYISNIGLGSHEEVDIPDYLKTIVTRSATKPESIETYFKECFKYKVARASVEACRKTEAAINKSINKSVGEIIEIAEKGLAVASTASIEDEFELTDIYENMDGFLEDVGESEMSQGILTPLPTWNRWWGPLTPGDFYVIAAPPKTGKSTILNFIADAPFSPFNFGKKVKVLILDTELETYRVRTRKASAMADVNEIFLKSGKWKKNAEMVEKVTSQFPKMKKQAGFVKHAYVANVPVEKICKIVRRWAATETDPDDMRLVIYDYLKITGEKIDDSNKEWQALGAKCDTLKHLMAEPGVRAAGLAAVQTNAANDVAASQRIKWFASAVFFFTKKTSEEMESEGEKFGTHYITPFVLRNLGEDWNNEEWVKEKKAGGLKFTANRLNIHVKNFHLEEAGTYQDVVDDKENQIDIEEPEYEGANTKRGGKPARREELL